MCCVSQRGPKARPSPVATCGVLASNLLPHMYMVCCTSALRGCQHAIRQHVGCCTSHRECPCPGRTQACNSMFASLAQVAVWLELGEGPIIGL